MKVLIIGNTGFIGRNIFQKLKVLDKTNLVGVSTKEIDLKKDESVIALSKYFSSDCIVVMCAGVKKQLGDTLITFDDNLTIIKNFCKAILLFPPKKIFFFCSASVYGEDVPYPGSITENTPVEPKTYYGIAKYSTERVLNKVCIDNRIELTILRPPLVYGKDDTSRGYGPTGFAHHLINNEKITIWGDGGEYREFIYINDVVNILVIMLNKESSGLFNLVSGTSYTFKNIIDLLNNTVNHKIEVVFCKRTKQKVDHRYSNEKIANIIGDFKFTDLKDGLSQTYSLLKKQSCDNK